MPIQPIESVDDMQELANQIRSGTMSDEDMDAGMAAIRAFQDGNMESTSPELADAKQNWGERMMENLQKRRDMMLEIAEAGRDGEQSHAEGMLQVVGKVGLGTAYDFLAETVVSGGRGLATVDGYATGGKGKELVTRAGHAFLETDIGQEGLEKLSEGMEAYGSWAEANPRAARNIEASVNIGTFIAPKIPIKGTISKITGGPTPKPAGTGAAAALRRSADETQFRRDSAWATQIVRPLKETMSEVEINDLTARTQFSGKGPFKRGKIQKSLQEETLADTFLSVPGVKPKNFLTENSNRVREHIARKGAELQAYVKKNDAPLLVKDLETRLNVVRKELAENVTVRGDAARAATDLVDDYLRIVQKGPTWKNKNGDAVVRASELLRARKDIDRQFSAAKRPPSADVATGQAQALNSLRREMNKTLNDSMGDDFVTRSLKTQSNLYKIQDALLPKAAKEFNNYFSRAWKYGMKFLPFRGEVNQLAALGFGVGGLGAGAIVGPLMSKALFTGAAGFGAYAAITSPATRRILAKMIEGQTAILRTVGKGTQAAIDLRAQRAYLISLMKEQNDLPVPPMSEESLIGLEHEDDQDKINATVGE